MTVFDNKSGIIWIVASQATLLIVNFFLIKLMTNLLSVESFGYYSLCMTIVFFSRQVIYDPLSIVVAKNCASTAYCPQGRTDGFGIVRFVTDRLGLLLFILGVLSAFFVYGVFNRLIGGVVIWSCFVYLFSNAAQGIYFNVFNSISYRKPAALFSMLDSVLKLVLVSIAFRFFGTEVVSTLIAISAGAFVVFFVIRRYVRTRFSLESFSTANLEPMVKHSFKMSLPFYLPVLFGAFKSVADPWILAVFVGLDELAAFNVLLQLGYFPVLLLVGILQTFVAPKIYILCAVQNDVGRAELKAFLFNILFVIFIFSCAAFGVAIVMADLIFHLFVGEYYSSLSMYIPVFVVSGALVAVSSVLLLVVIGSFDTSVVGKLMLVTVVAGVVCSFILIISYGLRGAIAGLLVTSLASTLLYWGALYFGVFKLPK